MPKTLITLTMPKTLVPIIVLKYNKSFITHLTLLIYRHVCIQKAPSIYLYMNEKRNKRFKIFNIKKSIDIKRTKILEKHGLKPYYKSKKEYRDHINSIKNKINDSRCIRKITE